MDDIVAAQTRNAQDAQAPLDLRLQGVAHRVRALQGGAVAELHVQVDVAPRAGPSGAQPVVPDHPARPERPDRLFDRALLLVGQREPADAVP